MAQVSNVNEISEISKPVTVRLAPSINSLYFGLMTVIAIMHAYRITGNSDWNWGIAFVAGVVDMSILLAMFTVFGGVNKLGYGKCLILLVNKSIHIFLIVSIALVALFSQLLFVKTGETLDLNIIRFAVYHASDLSAVVGSAVDNNAFLVIFLGLAPLLVASLELSHSRLRILRNVALVFPIALLPACTVLDSQFNDENEIVLEKVKGKELYRGSYLDLTAKALEWNTSSVPSVQRGIISGIVFSTSFGKVEYLSLAKNAGRDPVYLDPGYLGKRKDNYNIVFILLESFRYSAVGAYGSNSSSLPTNTPFIDSLANEGLLVERAYTTIPHTSKALVGIYCGTFPTFDSSISESRPGNLPIKCLPHILRDAGYRSGHFQTAIGTFEERVNFLKNAGFDYAITQEDLDAGKWERLGYLGLDDRALIEPMIKWMKESREQHIPYFASMLTLATHHPYATPGNAVTIRDPEQAYQSYIKAVRYTDNVLRELFAGMRAEGLLDQTIFVITGDHGEGFSEHGQLAHNGTAYEEGQRVPLIIYSPDIIEGKGKISGLRQHIDIMPTVLEAAGIEISGKLPGKSLLNDKYGHSKMITSCFYTDYCLNYYDDSGMKFIYYYGRRNPELYDLNNDKAEKVNLISQQARELPLESIMDAARLRNSYEHVYLPEQIVANTSLLE